MNQSSVKRFLKVRGVVEVHRGRPVGHPWAELVRGHRLSVIMIDPYDSKMSLSQRKSSRNDERRRKKGEEKSFEDATDTQ